MQIVQMVKPPAQHVHRTTWFKQNRCITTRNCTFAAPNALKVDCGFRASQRKLEFPTSSLSSRARVILYQLSTKAAKTNVGVFMDQFASTLSTAKFFNNCAKHSCSNIMSCVEPMMQPLKMFPHPCAHIRAHTSNHFSAHCCAGSAKANNVHARALGQILFASQCQRRRYFFANSVNAHPSPKHSINEGFQLQYLQRKRPLYRHSRRCWLKWLGFGVPKQQWPYVTDFSFRAMRADQQW